MKKMTLAALLAVMVVAAPAANAMGIFIATRLGDGTGISEQIGQDFLDDLSSSVTKHY